MVTDDYLSSLREGGVSYLLAGADDVDLSLALEKIGSQLFDIVGDDVLPRQLKLEGVERRVADVVWLRYTLVE